MELGAVTTVSELEDWHWGLGGLELVAGTITGDWHLELGDGTEGAGIWNWIKMGTRTPNLSPKQIKAVPILVNYLLIPSASEIPQWHMDSPPTGRLLPI